jgi:hypothetical protein
VSDGYDAKTVQRTFKKSMTTLRACYEKALATDECPTGDVTVTFAIGADDKASTSTRPASPTPSMRASRTYCSGKRCDHSGG